MESHTPHRTTHPTPNFSKVTWESAMTSEFSKSIRSATNRNSMWLAASLLVGTLGIAHAGTPTPVEDNVPSVAVSYGDLNIASAEGARTLYARIAAAARQVCPRLDVRDVEMTASVHSCREAAIARAVRDINDPRLAALQAEHAKRG
jgi:UrcA family protein